MSYEKGLYPTEEQLKAWQAQVARMFPGYQMYFDTRNSELGDEYSLHFKKTSAKATNLVGPLFSESPSWLPLEMLWRENGKSELDLLFELAAFSEVKKPENYSLWNIKSNLIAFSKAISPVISWFLCVYFSKLATMLGTAVIGDILPVTDASLSLLGKFLPWFTAAQFLFLLSFFWFIKSSNSTKSSILASSLGSALGVFWAISLCLDNYSLTTTMVIWIILRSLIISFLNISLSFLIAKKIIPREANQ
jgi:hypothetical protein